MRSMCLAETARGIALECLKPIWLKNITMITIMKCLGKRCALELREDEGAGSQLIQPRASISNLGFKKSTNFQKAKQIAQTTIKSSAKVFVTATK
jgi:hypothetical protein